MKFSANRFASALLLAGGVLLSGCLPSGQSAMDEEKEPHFLEGKSRASEMDSKGAIEAFEKALEVNPRSAAAHFELALLYEKKGTDPAAAIYHYDHVLKLRPGAENADVLVKPHILACKQELARTVSLGAVTERQQLYFEQLAEENRRLNEELQQWRGRSTTNPPSQPSAAVRTVQAPASAPSTPVRAIPSTAGNPARAPASVASSAPNNESRTLVASVATSRTHTVKSGDTPTTIARKYSVKVDALMAANPKLDARRLRVGQVVAVPSS
jgi:LysM repeat protein